MIANATHLLEFFFLDTQGALLVFLGVGLISLGVLILAFTWRRAGKAKREPRGGRGGHLISRPISEHPKIDQLRERYGAFDDLPDYRDNDPPSHAC